MTRDQDFHSNLAARTVFNGINAEQMFSAETVPLPELMSGEILVKVRLASICMSDVHTITGQRIEPTPSVLGHEAVVEVVDHRRPESDLMEGDRLTFSVADSCNKCEFCAKGLEQKCTKLFKYGHAKLSDGSGFNGCYASHIILRRGTHVAKIPETISDRCAAPINCSLATTMCAMEYVPKMKNGRAFVQGDGMLGFYTVVALRELGYETIFCSGNRIRRAEFLKRFGAIPIYNERRSMILVCRDCFALFLLSFLHSSIPSSCLKKSLSIACLSYVHIFLLISPSDVE